MPPPWFNDDDRLGAELSAAWAEGRDTPRRIVDVGKAALAWRTVDAELAALQLDSEVAGAGTRADAATLRTMSFTTNRITIELELTDEALLGQVVPPQSGRIELQLRQGPAQSAAVNAVGWFAIRPRPAGMFRLQLVTDDAHTTVTAWASA
jgi:hypothetical protein